MNAFPMIGYFKKWFGKYTQTKRTITFPVSVNTAARKLRIALLSPIYISGGYLSADCRYVGRIKETELSMTFATLSRKGGRLDYSMQGKLVRHKREVELQMVINYETAGSFFLAPASLSFIFIFSSGISVALLAFIPVLILSYLIMRWQMAVATDKLGDVLHKIVSGTA